MSDTSSSTSSSGRPRSSTASATSASITPASSTPPFNGSSIVASQSTAAPSPSSTDSGGSGPSLASSSSLYLYTFLATLVLLLGVSAAIVIRSFVLRRRHQALVEEAIRNGTWMPPPFGGRRRRGDIGEKPSMWEAWVGKDREQEVMRGDAQDEKSTAVGWNNILPISATYVKGGPPQPSPNTALFSPSRGHGESPRGFNIFPWRRNPAHLSSSSVNLPSSLPPPIPTSPTTNASATDPSTATDSTQTLQLTVLIAMPSPPSSRNSSDHGDEEEGPPVVEFGVLDVDVGKVGETSAGTSHTAPGAGNSVEGEVTT